MKNGTTLAEWISKKGMDPVEAMNRLQEHGVISDNCVSLEDVAKADYERAIYFLESPLDTTACRS